MVYLKFYLVLNKFSDDAVDVLFIKTKYVKGRHFVTTNCCFANSIQKRKQISTKKYGCNTVSWYYEHSF